MQIVPLWCCASQTDPLSCTSAMLYLPTASIETPRAWVAGTGKLHKPIQYKEELRLDKSCMAEGALDFRGSTYDLV